MKFLAFPPFLWYTLQRYDYFYCEVIDMSTMQAFRDLGVSEEILLALEKQGVSEPTKVQQEAIPPLLQWRDVIAKAPTGTG